MKLSEREPGRPRPGVPQVPLMALVTILALGGYTGQRDREAPPAPEPAKIAAITDIYNAGFEGRKVTLSVYAEPGQAAASDAEIAGQIEAQLLSPEANQTLDDALGNEGQVVNPYCRVNHEVGLAPPQMFYLGCLLRREVAE